MSRAFLGTVFLLLVSLPPSLAAQARSDGTRPGDPSVTAAELPRMKARFRAQLQKEGRKRAADFMRPSFAGSTFLIPEQAGAEREINDSIGYADHAVGSVQGALDSSTDIDVYRVDMPVNGRLQLSIQASGTHPLTDAAMTVTDAWGQFLLFRDDSAGTYFPIIDDHVAAGTYYVHVIGYQGETGTYQLNVGFAPSPFSMIIPGQNIADSFTSSPAEKGYTLVVPVASKVDISFKSPLLNLYVRVLNPRGSLHRFVDNSFSGGLSPAFDSWLPAGTYHLIVGDLLDTTGSFSFQVDLTPMAIPPLAVGGMVTGASIGYESMFLYKLVLAQDREVHFQAIPDPIDPLPNPAFILYDRNLSEIFYQDNDGALYTPNLQVPLPAGTYYLAWVDVGGNNGAMSVSTTVAPVANHVPVRLGHNNGVLPAGPGTFLLDLETRTPDFVEVNTLLTGTMADSQIAILDSSGSVMGANDDYLYSELASLSGTLMPADDYWILVREYDNLGGSFTVDVRPTIFYTDSVSNRHLNVVGKAGDWLGALVASLQETPNPFPLGYPLMGNILIDLNLFIALGFKQIPASGRTTLLLDFTSFPGVLQGLTVDTISVPMITTGQTTLVVH